MKHEKVTLIAVTRALMGPRFIDLPIRVLALLDLLAACVPDWMESTEASYLVFHFLAPLLTVAATTAPLASGMVSAGFFCLHLVLRPDDIDPFQSTVLFSAAVLLTHLHWRRALLVAAIGFSLTAVADALGAPAGFATPYDLLFFGWIQNSVLALAAASVEVRLRLEIERREEAAQVHERQLASERLRFAADTHDTVSQGLARQSMMIGMLRDAADPRERSSILGALSLANDDAQEQIRSYLERLRVGGGADASRANSDLSHAMRSMRESLQRAAEAGGLELQIDQRIPEGAIPSARFDDVRMTARELVTNMIKHAPMHSACTLAIHLEADTNTVQFVSRNPSTGVGDGDVPAPRSLSARAYGLQGSCTARVEGGEYVTKVTLPMKQIPENGDAGAVLTALTWIGEKTRNQFPCPYFSDVPATRPRPARHSSKRHSIRTDPALRG